MKTYEVGQAVFAQFHRGYGRTTTLKNGVVEKITKTQITVKFPDETARFMIDGGRQFGTGSGFGASGWLIPEQEYQRRKPEIDALNASVKLKADRLAILETMREAAVRGQNELYLQCLDKLCFLK